MPLETVPLVRDGEELVNRRSEAGGRRLALVSVPTGWKDERDFYVVCSCGWCSLPYVSRPREIECEACAVLAEGRRHFEDFAGRAAIRGHRIEWQGELVQTGMAPVGR